MWRKDRDKRSAVVLLAMILCAAAPVLPQAASTPKQARAPAGERLDVNRASMEELLKLPGVTQIWAERIVRFRPYHAKSDLRNRGVIPARVYHRIEDLIVAHKE
jgi:competence protein ComEA